MVMSHSTSATSDLFLERARAYLEYSANGPADLFSVQASLDSGFRRIIPRPLIRSRIKQISGVDPGFDIGADAFPAMIGMALSRNPDPVVPENLLARFAEQAAMCHQRYRYSYFLDTPQFAADTDCTSLSASALYEHGRLSASELGSTARELLSATAPLAAQRDHGADRVDSPDRPGVIMVYWDDDADPAALSRGRKYDAVVCANALYTLSLAQLSGACDEGAEILDATSRYVGAHLNPSAYLSGTRYYPDPNAFLFAVSRLCGRFPTYRQSLGHALSHQITRGTSGAGPRNPLSLALSIITADTMGVPPAQLDEPKRLLMRYQRDDGSWPAAPYYQMGRFAVYFGSPLLTTLFAVRALWSARQADVPGLLLDPTA